MSALTDVFTAIGNAIRGKNGLSTTYKPSEMATAIDNLPTFQTIEIWQLEYLLGLYRQVGSSSYVPVTISNIFFVTKADADRLTALSDGENISIPCGETIEEFMTNYTYNTTTYFYKSNGNLYFMSSTYIYSDVNVNLSFSTKNIFHSKYKATIITKPITVSMVISTQSGSSNKGFYWISSCTMSDTSLNNETFRFNPTSSYGEISIPAGQTSKTGSKPSASVTKATSLIVWHNNEQVTSVNVTYPSTYTQINTYNVTFTFNMFYVADIEY